MIRGVETAPKSVAVEVTGNGETAISLNGIRALVLFGGIPLHGQERANIEIFRASSELGLKAKFVTHRERGHEQVEPHLSNLTIPWVSAEFGPLIGRNIVGKDLLSILRGVFQTSWIVSREIRKWKPTHLYLMNWLYVLYAAPAVFLSRVPVIYRLGDSPPTHSALHRLLWKLICRRASLVVCVSKYIHRQLLDTAPPGTPSTVIYSFPPERANRTAPTTRVKPAGATAIVYVGQISEAKGIPQLIEAARSLINRGKNIVTWIAGDYTYNNPMAERLINELANESLTDKIQFLGYVSDAPGLMSQADIHVCPSVWEDPLPNVILEAKSAGLPTVAFPTGGVPELIRDGEDGLLCSEPTAQSLADTLETYITDERKRTEAGAAARRSLETKFAYDRFQHGWAAVFLKTWKYQGRQTDR